MSDWAEVTFNDGTEARIAIEVLGELGLGDTFTLHRDSHGVLWAAPYSVIKDGAEARLIASIMRRGKGDSALDREVRAMIERGIMPEPPKD